MRRIMGLFSLMVFLAAGIPAASALAPLTGDCTKIPDTFENWKLLDIYEDQYKVIRWFAHPSISSCRGISQALLIDCKEYPILRLVFTIDKNDKAVESAAALRMIDGYWKNGQRVFTGSSTDTETGDVTFRFILEGGESAQREITTPARSTYSCDASTLFGR